MLKYFKAKIKISNSRAFTLIEILVSMTIFVLVLSSVFAIFSFSISRNKKLIDTQSQIAGVRQILGKMNRELKGAKINTSIVRANSICPNINEVFKINNASGSIGFLLDDKCVRYKLGTVGLNSGVLMRDEERASDGAILITDAVVSDPRLKIILLNFTQDKAEGASVTIDIKVKKANEVDEKAFSLQSTVKNIRDLTLKKDYVQNISGYSEIYDTDKYGDYVYAVTDTGLEAFYKANPFDVQFVDIPDIIENNTYTTQAQFEDPANVLYHIDTAAVPDSLAIKKYTVSDNMIQTNDTSNVPTPSTTGGWDSGSYVPDTEMTGNGDGAGVTLSSQLTISWAETTAFSAGDNLAWDDYPALGFADLDGDGDYDAIGGYYSNYLKGFRNNGTLLPDWKLDNTLPPSSYLGSYLGPSLADLNGDGLYDLIIGRRESGLMAYKNTGNIFSPSWTLDSSLISGIPNIGYTTSPAFDDVDGDGDYDVFIADNAAPLLCYRNNGSASSPNFVGDSSLCGGNLPASGLHLAPAFVDLDEDGISELIIGKREAYLYWYKNMGTQASPNWQVDSSLSSGVTIPALAYYPQPAFVDLDGDGDKDLVIAVYQSYNEKVYWFENTSTPVYSSEGTYTAKFDTEVSGTINFDSLQLVKSSTSGGTGSTEINIKIKSTSGAAPSDAEFDAMAGNCNITVSADNTHTFNDLSCAGSGRYLWYKATLTSSADQSKAPILEDLQVSFSYDEYYPSADFTSSIYDTGGNHGFGNVVWNHTVGGADSEVIVQVKSCSIYNCSDKLSWNGCEVATNSDLSDGACVNDGERYVWYRVILNQGSDLTQTPFFHDLSFSYYPSYEKLKIANSRLYAMGEGSVAVFDITTFPETPAFLGSYKGKVGSFQGFDVGSSYAYVADFGYDVVDAKIIETWIQDSEAQFNEATGGNPNLIGHWKMENNWADSSGNGNNGITVGSPGFSSDAVKGFYAGDFNGYIKSNFASGAYPVKGGFFWFKTAGGNTTILGLSADKNNINADQINVGLSGGFLELKVRDGVADKSFSSATGLLNDNTWHLGGFILRSDGWDIIVDGDIDASGTDTFALDNITGFSIWCGMGYDQGCSGTLGKADDVRVYGSVLTPAQAKNIYLNARVSTDQSLGSVELAEIWPAGDALQTTDLTDEQGFNKAGSLFDSNDVEVVYPGGLHEDSYVALKPIAYDWVDGDFNDNCSWLNNDPTKGVVQDINGVQVEVFWFNSFNLSIICNLTGSYPIQINVNDGVNISGSLRANGGTGGNYLTGIGGIGVAGGGNGGTGANHGSSGTPGVGKGPGGIGGGRGPENHVTGGGGGGYGGEGGGSDWFIYDGGGDVYGDGAITILYPGSGGGSGYAAYTYGGPLAKGGGGGAGGGVINIRSISFITIPSGSSIQANGGKGGMGHPTYSDNHGGGGGSGGAIKLEAPFITMAGSLSVGGGDGANEGSGGGGGGRIFLGGSSSISGTISAQGGDRSPSSVNMSERDGRDTNPPYVVDENHCGIPDYPEKAYYSSYIDSGSHRGAAWKNFIWTKSEDSGTTEGSITFRVLTTPDKVSPSSADFDAGCFIDVAGKNLNQNNMYDLKTSCDPAVVDTNHRYLWYRAEFVSNICRNKTPKLDDVQVSWEDYYYTNETYSSDVKDTRGNSGFYIADWDEDFGNGNVTIEARSCNNADCSDKTWTGCAITNFSDLSDGACVTDGERYFQYRLILDSNGDYTVTPDFKRGYSRYFPYAGNADSYLKTVNISNASNPFAVSVAGTSYCANVCVDDTAAVSLDGTNAYFTFSDSIGDLRLYSANLTDPANPVVDDVNYVEYSDFGRPKQMENVPATSLALLGEKSIDFDTIIQTDNTSNVASIGAQGGFGDGVNYGVYNNTEQDGSVPPGDESRVILDRSSIISSFNENMITANSSNDYFGISVSGAGDVNGDGHDDVIVGAWYDEKLPSNGTGGAYVYSGADLSVILGSVFGDTNSDRFGYSVSGAGDVNNDGYADVIVGAYWDDPTGLFNAGSAYVYFGPDLSSSIQLKGDTASDYFGYSVSGAGDVNNDGYDDVIVGAYADDPLTGTDNAGSAYVYFGPNLSSLSRIQLKGDTAVDLFGTSVSGAGDVNNDGYADVIVGAYQDDPLTGTDNAGSAYVYFGPNLSSLSRIQLKGDTNSDRFGYSVSGAGDVNNDGYADVIVGAYWDDPLTGTDNAGSAYVYSGQDYSLLVQFSGDTASDYFGYSVSGAGDVNNDGYADVIVGAYMDDPLTGTDNAGSAYVYSGQDYSLLVQFSGDTSSDRFGISVSGAGDVNGDGYDDVVIGADEYEFNIFNLHAGAAYIYEPIVSFYNIGAYAAYLDGGAGADYHWKDFSWKGLFPLGDDLTQTSINFKFKTSNSPLSPPDFSNNACETGVSTLNGAFDFRTCDFFRKDCINKSDRYLWYEATLYASDDLKASPYLNEVESSLKVDYPEPDDFCYDNFAITDIDWLGNMSADLFPKTINKSGVFDITDNFAYFPQDDRIYKYKATGVPAEKFYYGFFGEGESIEQADYLGESYLLAFGKDKVETIKEVSVAPFIKTGQVYGNNNQGGICKVEGDGNYVYVVYKNSAVEAFDKNNLEWSRELSGSINISEVIDVALYGNYLIIFGFNSDYSDGYYRVVDISPVKSGNNPVDVIGGSGTADIISYLAIKDNYLFASLAKIGLNNGGLKIFSIAPDGTLSVGNTIYDSNSYYTYHLAIDGNFLFQEVWADADTNRRLKKFNISNPTSPALEGTYPDINPGSMVIKNGLLYASGNDLNVYDFDNIAAGNEINTTSAGASGYNYDLQIAGSNLLLSRGSSSDSNIISMCRNFDSSAVIDISNAESPLIKNYYSGGMGVVIGDYIYREGANNKIEIMKIFDSGSATER